MTSTYPMPLRRRAIVQVRINELLRVWRSDLSASLGLALADDSVEILCEPDGTLMSLYYV